MSQPGIPSLRDLYHTELQDIYSAEHCLLSALQDLEKHSTRPELDQAFAALTDAVQGLKANLDEHEALQRVRSIGEQIHAEDDDFRG